MASQSRPRCVFQLSGIYTVTLLRGQRRSSLTYSLACQTTPTRGMNARAKPGRHWKPICPEMEGLNALISETETGRALNEVLGHAAQGSWEEAEGALTSRSADFATLTRVLCEPTYGPETDAKLLAKAYSDCLRSLRRAASETAYRELQEQLKVATGRDEKREILARMQAIRRGGAQK